jgi:predicted small metal-binding protein
MSKVLHCNDLIPGCPFKAHGDSEQEILTQVAAHVKSAHNIQELSPEFIDKVQRAIHDQ